MGVKSIRNTGFERELHVGGTGKETKGGPCDGTRDLKGGYM